MRGELGEVRWKGERKKGGGLTFEWGPVVLVTWVKSIVNSS